MTDQGHVQGGNEMNERLAAQTGDQAAMLDLGATHDFGG